MWTVPGGGHPASEQASPTSCANRPGPSTPPFPPSRPLTPSFPTPDRESIPGAGPLVLRLSKAWGLKSGTGCGAGGGPHPTVTSRQSPPPPICYVIPRPREGSQAPVSRHGIHHRSPPSNFRECKGYSLPFLKQSKPCLKPQNNQNPPPPPRHSRLRSGIHPEGRGRVPVGATGWSPFPVRNAGRGSPSPCPQRHAKSPKIPLGVVQSNQLRVQSTFNQTSWPQRTHTQFDILTKRG